MIICVYVRFTDVYKIFIHCTYGQEALPCSISSSATFSVTSPPEPHKNHTLWHWCVDLEVISSRLLGKKDWRNITTKHGISMHIPIYPNNSKHRSHQVARQIIHNCAGSIRWSDDPRKTPGYPISWVPHRSLSVSSFRVCLRSLGPQAEATEKIITNHLKVEPAPSWRFKHPISHERNPEALKVCILNSINLIASVCTSKDVNTENHVTRLYW